MTINEEIRDIFSILHDGEISSWTGDKKLLTLKIECQYLAKHIDKSFDSFFIELININTFYLTTWPNPINLPVLILTDLNDIFKAKLEIISADIIDDLVIVDCAQQDIDFDYCGGKLTISCEAIKIYGQNKNELTIDEFYIVYESYCDEETKKLEQIIIDRQNYSKK